MPNTYKGVLSGTFDQNVASFLNSNGSIQVLYGGGQGNSRLQGNTIFMVDTDVRTTAAATGVSYDQAYAQILVHELGHWVYQVRDYASYGNVNSTASYKNWFYTREGESTIFGAVVTAEVRDNDGAFRVAGTSSINDLFSKANAAIGAAFASGVVDVFSAAAATMATYFAQDNGYQQAANAGAQTWSQNNANYLPASLSDSYSDYSGGCVEVGSYLPCGRRAGEVMVGDEMQLADETNLTSASGIVTYSKRKSAQGFQVETESDCIGVFRHSSDPSAERWTS